jgi:hypothetical protein
VAHRILDSVDVLLSSGFVTAHPLCFVDEFGRGQFNIKIELAKEKGAQKSALAEVDEG